MSSDDFVGVSLTPNTQTIGIIKRQLSSDSSRDQVEGCHKVAVAMCILAEHLF